MSLAKTITRKSKYLSLLLRHNPSQAGLVLDDSGWANVSNLLKALNWNLSELEEIVYTDEKKRYEFDRSKTKIRASQGHSINIDLGYEIKDPPEYLYHGTSSDNLDKILSLGLLKMQRHDVHMFDDEKYAIDLAIRRRKNPILIRIYSEQMRIDAYEFRLSTNNIWLTKVVPPKYLIAIDI